MNERMGFLREKTSKLTTSPGVYIMKDEKNKIIYIGKAKNLKNRVTSYFRENPDYNTKVEKMVSLVYDYDFIVTDTEYEALLLECSMIKQHKPKYNILLKDDKGYHYIKVSDENYPRITAEKKNTDSGIFFGPYMSSSITKQTVNEVNAVFMLPVCKRKFPQEFGKGRPCLYFHIKRCMGVCMGKISEKKYAEIIKQAVEYMKDGSQASVERMQKEMEEAAEKLDFEKAALLRDRINAVKKAAQSQKIMDSGLNSVDVAAMAKNDNIICVVVLVYRDGRLADKSSYFLDENNSDENIMEAFITQYYMSNEVPDEILLHEELPDEEIIEQMLKEKCGHGVHIVQRQKGNYMKLIMLAKSNAEEELSLKVGRTGKEIAALEELAKLLGLEKTPSYIEAYDISNLASTAMVAGMAVFENGRPLKSAYKKFSIKEVETQNDYECMREVIRRRFRHYLDGDKDTGFSRLPDLIFLDGGKGHVNAITPLLSEMGISVPVFGIVKDSKHKTRAIASGGKEISVTKTKAAFMLITKIQDEMHRFAISYQQKKHASRSYELELTKIKGIGIKKAQKLIIKYKTKEKLKAAGIEELEVTAGVGKEIAKQLYELIQKM